MGGPCFIIAKNGKKIIGPRCTDNFLIKPFGYNGATYYSCEQAYQALKFEDQADQARIRSVVPFAGESDSGHGMRCWSAGQRGKGQMRRNWDSVKIRVMLEVNRAKYIEHADLRMELLSTGTAEIQGAPSTSWYLNGKAHNWSHWNGLVQMRLREEFTPTDLKTPGLLERLTSQFDAVSPRGKEESEQVVSIAALEKHGLVMPWTCAPCTYVNETVPHACEVCNSNNPVYASARASFETSALHGAASTSVPLITEKPSKPGSTQAAEEASSKEASLPTQVEAGERECSNDEIRR